METVVGVSGGAGGGKVRVFILIPSVGLIGDPIDEKVFDESSIGTREGPSRVVGPGQSVEGPTVVRRQVEPVAPDVVNLYPPDDEPEGGHGADALIRDSVSSNDDIFDVHAAIVVVVHDHGRHPAVLRPCEECTFFRDGVAVVVEHRANVELDPLDVEGLNLARVPFGGKIAIGVSHGRVVAGALGHGPGRKAQDHRASTFHGNEAHPCSHLEAEDLIVRHRRHRRGEPVVSGL